MEMMMDGAQFIARGVDEGGFREEMLEKVATPQRAIKKNYKRDMAYGSSAKTSSSAEDISKSESIYHRTNFLETIFTKHGIYTDDNGVANFTFTTSDSVTTYRILLEALYHESQQPIEKNGFNMFSDFSKLLTCKNKFYVEPKLPSFVVEGDILKVPISYLYNDQDKIKVESKLEFSKQISYEKYSNIFPFHMQNKENTRRITSLKIGDIETRTDLNLTVKAIATTSDEKQSFGDIVTREFVATPKGFPQNLFFSGSLNNQKSTSFQLFLPKNSFKISTTNSKIFPKPTSTLIAAIDTLIQQPGGKLFIYLFIYLFILNFLKVALSKHLLPCFP